MEYSKGEWKLPCGCTIFLETNSPPFLTHCPIHKAAPDMYEALIEAQKVILLALDRGIFYPVLARKVKKVLAKAENK